MATIKHEYGTSNQAITITLDSLASSATDGRQSSVVSNTTDKFLDALVVVKVKLATGTPGNDKAVHVFAYGSADGGTTYSDGATGSDAAMTPTDPTNLKYLGSIATPTSGGAYVGGPWSIAKAFGGVLPERWGLVVRNYSGIALDTTGNSAHYQGVYASSV